MEISLIVMSENIVTYKYTKISLIRIAKNRRNLKAPRCGIISKSRAFLVNRIMREIADKTCQSSRNGATIHNTEEQINPTNCSV